MSLTNAILTGFTGIRSNQVAVDTIGNNVANLNTTGYKSSRTLFETLFVQTIAGGTAPDETHGGTNPSQIGYGSGVATIQKTFAQGTTEQTGVVTDLAIDGDGFFILQTPDQSQVYTRAGGFDLNTQNLLTAPDGSFVQGFSASADGTIETGRLGNLEVPIGVTSDAAATTQATMFGNLNAAGELATTGSVSISEPLTTTGGAPATATTPLADLLSTAGDPLFRDADVITVSGVQKGGIDLPDAQFVVGSDGTTYGDLAAFLATSLGIDTSDTAIGSPEVTIGDGTVAPAGALVIRSNAGDVHALSVDGTSIRNTTNGAAPFVFTTNTPATGQGATTTFRVFDSLGTPVDLRLRVVPESRSDAGTVWRFSAESVDDTGGGAFLGDGTISFDQNGRFIAATGTDLTIGRAGTGAVTPLALSVDFSDLTSLTADEDSDLKMAFQDGFPAGTLTAFDIDAQGVITGTFDNGQEQVFGQVALATFANNQGLVAQSQNTFTVGVNSGPAVIGTPQSGAAGRINARQLELGNVDLSRELIGLITASTGFSAASRTVRTADDMLQELMLLVR